MRLNTITKRSSLTLAIIGLIIGSAQAEASLVGEEMTATGSGFAIPDSPNTTTVVDPGVEFAGILCSVDVGASSVLFASTAGSQQNFGGTQTVTLSGLDFESTPGTSIIGTTTPVVSGIANFNVTGFTADSVTFTFQGTTQVGATASFDLITDAPVAPTPLPFSVVSSGTDLIFTWDSQVGKRYDLLSSTDPETDGDPASWPEVAGSQDLLTDTLTIVRPADEVRFYVVREENVPPPEPVVAFSDDFESVPDPDWTTGANLGDADNTIWERGAPVADLGGGAMGPATGANGTTNCYGTNIGAIYGSDTDIYLRSPPINLTNLTGENTATLTLQYFVDTDLANPNPDMGSIRVLNANNLGEQLGADLTGSEGLGGLGSDGWIPFSEPLPAEARGETVVLEFQFTSNGDAQNFGGFYIDEVAVTTE